MECRLNSHLNRVRHAALESRGAGIVALHLHYEHPHTRQTLGRFYRSLGKFLSSRAGVYMKAEVEQGGQVICLIPLEPITEEGPFKAVSTELGYPPPDGILPFIQRGSCEPIETVSLERH